MANKQYVEEVYKTLVDAYGVDNVGDKGEFSKNMQDEDFRKDMHENIEDIQKEKAPDFATFEEKYNEPEKKKRPFARFSFGFGRFYFYCSVGIRK